MLLKCCSNARSKAKESAFIMGVLDRHLDVAHLSDLWRV